MFTITEPVSYTYKAENLCSNCTIEALKSEGLAQQYDSGDEGTIRLIASVAGYDYEDQYSYDSGDFPKPVMSWQIECGFDTDGMPDDEQHEHCDACHSLTCGED